MQSCGVKSHATIAYVEGNLFPDVSVELHASSAYFKSFHYASRLQDWIHSYHWEANKREMGYQTPSDSFNLVYLLVHLYHHFLYEGVGFRQLMDYYMLLKSIPTNVRPICYRNTMQTLDSFGMVGFTEGVMYLMNTLAMTLCYVCRIRTLEICC